MTRNQNFRLNDSTVLLLEDLAERENKTKTAIVREAIVNYYADTYKYKNSLLELAGTISEKSAEKMKRIINENKTSKPVPKL